MLFSPEKCGLGGLLLLLSSSPRYAQTAAPPSGVQYVQTDIGGDWPLKIHEDDRYRNPGAEIGEYEGILLSPAGRLKASSWNAPLNTLPERQCMPLPVDDKNGGTIVGEIGALNHIIELTVPKDKQEGGTYVIPGHGRLCDEADVVEYRDMVTIIRDGSQDMVQQQMTLEKILAAKLTLDYDPRYGQPSWTGDMFVKSIYEDLTKSK